MTFYPARDPDHQFGPTILYLVDATDAGSLYEVAVYDGAASVLDRRMDGSAALVWTTDGVSPDPKLLLVDIASGEHEVLGIDGLDSSSGRPYPEVGFTSPSGIHVVAHTVSGTSESLAYYDLSGNLLQELYSQPTEQSYQGSLNWLYGLEGLDLVVGHQGGLAYVDNKGELIRDLWTPEGIQQCRPVRWWSEDAFIGSCEDQQLWRLTTDGAPGQLLSAVPQDLTPHDEYTYLDAWPAPSGTLLRRIGPCEGAAVEVGHNGETTVVTSVPGLVDVVGERAATTSALGCGSHGRAFYTYDLQTAETNVIIAQNEQILGVTSALGLATAYQPPPLPPYQKYVEEEHKSAFPVGLKDWLGGWGYITSINPAGLVFDLIEVMPNVPGDESAGVSFSNPDPTLRHLPLSPAIEIRACPPAPGEQAPARCGSPWVGPESWEFSLWTPKELAGFVEAGDTLWLVQVDPQTGEVVWIEQWWHP